MNPIYLILFALLIASAGCARSSSAEGGEASSHAKHSEMAAASAPTPSGTSAATIRAVESKRVCMINNRLMNEDQIPVAVAGKTYFGCCPMCKERLENDPKSRLATDPVSGRPVDKSVAVIGARPSGAVVYFESQENFDKFAAR